MRGVGKDESRVRTYCPGGCPHGPVGTLNGIGVSCAAASACLPLRLESAARYADIVTQGGPRKMDVLRYWGLREKPFETTLDPRYFYASPIHSETLARLELLAEDGDMGFGMLTGEDFSKGLEEVTLDLEPGDLLFFYTDGLTEARNASGQMFGLDRALRVLESHPRRKPKGQLEAVRQAVGEFRDGREPDDDVTMIVFRRTC